MDTTQPVSEPQKGCDVAATYCATLVDEWVRLGMTDAVICPGSRSTPMALAAAQDSRLRVSMHHDERSASFMALGLGLSTGRAALLLCTSGTAAAEFHAAVIEAHQAFVPLLVMTADRPDELHGVGAPQTINQRDLFGSAVRWYCEPGVPAEGGAPWWRDLARDSWIRTLGEHPGPVHLNQAFREPLIGTAGELPALREPLVGFSDDAMPATGAQWGVTDEELAKLVVSFSGRTGVIIAGVRAARTVSEVSAIFELARHLGWVVIADPASGCRIDQAETITASDALLRSQAFAVAHQPEVIIRLGGLLSSRALNSWVASAPALKIGIDCYGSVPDPDAVLNQKIPADIESVCRQLQSVVHQGAPAAWREAWISAEQTATQAINSVLGQYVDATEPAVVIDLFTLLPEDGILVLSSSMPVRDAEWYAPARSGLRVLSNRGANGIDGVTSTAVGAALPAKVTVLLIGDIAFLHDTNALLGLLNRHVNLVIVVIDNDGGGIFSFLSPHALLESTRFEQLFGTPHGVDLLKIAAAHQIPAERVSTRTGVQAAIAGALTRGGPRIVVVPTNREQNLAVHEALNEAVSQAVQALEQ
ncbi:MAG: 2-succinyl-5-enolpyruvyl-6-hydroxy-3-cyclohexene-1-carboxylic-acid synthase [Microthrixaceae bacterium]